MANRSHRKAGVAGPSGRNGPRQNARALLPSLEKYGHDDAEEDPQGNAEGQVPGQDTERRSEGSDYGCPPGESISRLALLIVSLVSHFPLPPCGMSGSPTLD